MEPLIVNFRWTRNRSKSVDDGSKGQREDLSRNAKFVAGLKTSDPKKYKKLKDIDAIRKRQSYVRVSERSSTGQRKQEEKGMKHSKDVATKFLKKLAHQNASQKKIDRHQINVYEI